MLEAFVCPITQDVMEDPVVTADGHTYERSAIARWLRDHGTSPVTNCVLTSSVLSPNYALKRAIAEFRAHEAPPSAPELPDEPPWPAPPMGYFVYHVAASTSLFTAPALDARVAASHHIIAANELVLIAQCVEEPETGTIFLQLADANEAPLQHQFIRETADMRRVPVRHARDVYSATQYARMYLRPSTRGGAVNTHDAAYEGDMVSADLHVVNPTSQRSYVRLEGSTTWLLAASLHRVAYSVEKLLFRAPYAVDLFANAEARISHENPLVTLPIHALVTASRSIPFTDGYVVQVTYDGITGWATFDEEDRLWSSPPRLAEGPPGRQIPVAIVQGRWHVVVMNNILDDGSIDQEFHGSLPETLVERLMDCKRQGRLITHAAIGPSGEWYLSTETRDGTNARAYCSTDVPAILQDRLPPKATVVFGPNKEMLARFGDAVLYAGVAAAIATRLASVETIEAVGFCSNGSLFLKSPESLYCGDGITAGFRDNVLSASLDHGRGALCSVSVTSRNRFVAIHEHKFRVGGSIPPTLRAHLTAFYARHVRVRNERRQLAMHTSFVCPLTHRVMVDPVVAADGRSYERAAIAKWLETHEAAPGAETPLPSKALLPNLALRDAIREAAAKGTEQLPQAGYFIYRCLRSMHACALPSFLHRGMLPNRQPFVMPADDLVIVTRRERGAGCNDVFLRTEGNIFLFESEFGVPTAVRIEPLRELRVYRARKVTSLTLRPVKFAPMPQTRTIQPGEIISTDMFVHDANGFGFARSESSGSWVSTMFLDLVPPPPTKPSFRVQAATMLFSNCLATDARVISSTVIPQGTVVVGQIAVPMSATKLAVRTTYSGVTGWFEASTSMVVTASSDTNATATDAPPAKVRRLDSAHVAPSSQPTSRPVAAPGALDSILKELQGRGKAAATSKSTTAPAQPTAAPAAAVAVPTPAETRAATPSVAPATTVATPAATPVTKATTAPVAAPAASSVATPAATPSATPVASPAAALTANRVSATAQPRSNGARDTTPVKTTVATPTKALEASHATSARAPSMAPTTTATHSFLSPSSVRNASSLLSSASPAQRQLQATAKPASSPSTTKAASAPQARAGISGTSLTAAPAPTPVGKMPRVKMPTPTCTPTPVTSTLPQTGYFIYRTLDRVVLSRTPSTSDRLLLPSGAPRRLPPNELVVVTQRVRGDVHSPVFLALESDATDPMFLPEAIDGVDVAEVVVPASDIAVYETIAPAPVTRHPMAPTPTDARLPPGCLISTDLHVDDMTGGEYVRLEHSMHWVPLACLRHLKHVPGQHSFVMDDATQLVSNAYSRLSVPIAVVPRGTTLVGRMVVDLPRASQCLVRAVYKGATGWLFATRPASLLAAVAPVAPKQPRTPVKPDPSSDSDVEIVSPPTTRTKEEPRAQVAPAALPVPTAPVAVAQPRQEPLVSVSQQRHICAPAPRRSKKTAASKARPVPPPIKVVPPGRQLKVVLRGGYFAVLHTPLSGCSTILGEYLPLPLTERIRQVCFVGHCITHMALSPDDAWYLSLQRSAGAAYTIVSPSANDYVRHHAKPKMHAAFANGRIVLAPEAGPALSRGFAGSFLQRRLSSSKKVDILAMDDDGSVFMRDAIGHVAHGLSQLMLNTILEPSPVGGGALVDVVLSKDKWVLLYEHTFRASPTVPSVVVNLLHKAYGMQGHDESTLDPATTDAPVPVSCAPTTVAPVPPSAAAAATEEQVPTVPKEPDAVAYVKPEPTPHASSEITRASDVEQEATAEPDPAVADETAARHPASPAPSRPAPPTVVGEEEATLRADAASTPSIAADDASDDAVILKAEVLPSSLPPPSRVKQEPSAFEFVPSTPSPLPSPAQTERASPPPVMQASPTPPPASAPVRGRLHASLLASFEEDDIDVWSIS
ncbi:hypothetical protein SPRG_03324 [Saprolegnia parasitica CBS 223.65]|uniref:U-box domain-containing protein n=1 Tax=Saprolegnia parasitica (strain CBS 223.65) TaxID=695850 RepID=A0A067D025_SAPPC|nr:hypothetical protein SPRG_03324 [Saprolegnia parasitica CBS 223.65]KDO32106.1 hypothetical protein SPRG_03324 [Saprolegnia parasitica CBS 223.65]|eukprot:XP_012197291.1 hypothetical protein SPRG_03324 [Saprolegnia parasitica CBS 223.65]